MIKRAPTGASSAIFQYTRSDYTSDAAVSPGEGLFLDDRSDVAEVSSSHHLSVVAGEVGRFGRPTPGRATESRLDFVEGVAFDAEGNLYIADSGNDVVERVSKAGYLSVIAGKVRQVGAPTSGPASQSTLTDPGPVAVNSAGDVYVASAAHQGGDTDPGGRVSEITPDGKLSVIAGDGSAGSPELGGPAIREPLSRVIDLTTDPAGDIFFLTYGPGIGDVNGGRLVELNASGTVLLSSSVRSASDPFGRAVAEKCGSGFVLQGIRFDSAGDAFVYAAAGAYYTDTCVIRMTPRHRAFLLVRSPFTR